MNPRRQAWPSAAHWHPRADRAAVEFNQFQPDKSTLRLRLETDERAGRRPLQELSQQARLRPGEAGCGQGELEIDLASIDAGSKDANDEVARSPSVKMSAIMPLSMVLAQR